MTLERLQIGTLVSVLVTALAAVSIASVAAPASPAAAAFPGSNGKIAFVKQLRFGGNCCQNVIETMSPSGGGQVQLTDPHVGNVFGSDEDPMFSADGTMIAFTREIESSSAIWTMNADGTNQTQRTSGGDNLPAWSPDGTKIAFTSARDNGSGDIYVQPLGGFVVRLTTDGGNSAPAWSPDGTEIAFVHECVRCGPDEVTATDVYVMNADGSNRRDLTNDLDYNDFDPAWSPDGRDIAFASERDGDFSTHIYKTSASGNGAVVVRLTNMPEVTDTSPAWAPNGGGIVFDSDRSGSLGDIWEMGASGGGQHELTTANPATNPQNMHPDWQPTPIPATITLAETLVPPTDPGRFDLKIVGVATVKAAAGNGDSGSATTAPGTYTIKETAAAGTSLANYTSSIACTLNGGTGPSASKTSLLVTVAPADQLGCTFTNTRKATITLAETLVPPTDPGRFDLKIVGVATVKAAAGNGDSGSATTAPGTYTIKETAAAGTSLANYTSSIACTLNGGTGPSASKTSLLVTVAPADQLDCTFTNTR